MFRPDHHPAFGHPLPEGEGPHPDASEYLRNVGAPHPTVRSSRPCNVLEILHQHTLTALHTLGRQLALRYATSKKRVSRDCACRQGVPTTRTSNASNSSQSANPLS